MIKKLVVAGFSRRACDVHEDRLFLTMLDTNGTVIQTTTLQLTGTIGIQPEFKDLVQHSDSSFYAISDSLVFHFDKNLNFIDKQHSGMKGLSSITSLNSGNLLLNGLLNNVLNNVEIHPSLTIINQLSCMTSVTKMARVNTGSFIALNGSFKLEKFPAVGFG